MNSIIKEDLYRYFKLQGLKGFFKAIIRIPGFKFTYFFRKASASNSFLVRYFYSFLKNHYARKYGFQIPNGTKIGKGFFIMHFGFIVINKEAVIGDYCNIHPGVTIGQTNRGKNKGAPRIGNCVWIGTGAVIVGNINIGSNVLIAPNAYINFDVPDNSIVLGNPGKIIPNENATKDYITFILQN